MHIWTYWEDVQSESLRPWYIDACLQTMKAHCNSDGFELHILGVDNYQDYLPEITSDILQLKSKYPRLKARFRANYIRGWLLYNYGGVWLDADTIVLNNFHPVLELLNNHDFVGAITPKRQQIITGFLAVNPKTNIMEEYIAKFDKILQDNKDWISNDSYTIPVMTDIVDRESRNDDGIKMHIYTGNEVYPIKYPDRDVFIRPGNVDDYIDATTMCVMLFNNSYSWQWKAESFDRMIGEDILLSKLLKYGLEKCNV